MLSNFNMQGIFLALRVPFLFIQILILILGKHHLLLLSWKYYFLNFSAVTFVLQVSEFFFPCVWFCICFSHRRLFTNCLETLALESRSEALCGRTGLWSPGRMWAGLAERLLGEVQMLRQRVFLWRLSLSLGKSLRNSTCGVPVHLPRF